VKGGRKGVTCTLLGPTPYSRERLKLETSKLASRLITRCSYEKKITSSSATAETLRCRVG